MPKASSAAASRPAASPALPRRTAHARASTTTPAGSPRTPQRAGNYFGYDGPFPPFNDSLVHHYVFTLYALDLPRLPLEGVFTGPQVREAIAGHVLGAATHSGTYTLNRRLLG